MMDYRASSIQNSSLIVFWIYLDYSALEIIRIHSYEMLDTSNACVTLYAGKA